MHARKSMFVLVVQLGRYFTTNGMGNSTDMCCFIIQRIKKMYLTHVLELTYLNA